MLALEKQISNDQQSLQKQQSLLRDKENRLVQERDKIRGDKDSL